MPGMIKYHDYRDIGHMLKHYNRTVAGNNYGNEKIDPEKLPLDRQSNRAPAGNDTVEHIKEVVERVADGMTIRKDAVKMVEWDITEPRFYLGDTDAFFDAVYNFNVQRYGAMNGDNIISAHVHFSESQPHMHFAFVPVKTDATGKQSLCAKDIVCQQDLKTYHEDLENYLIDRGLCQKGQICNGNTIKKTNGRAYSVAELKRGAHVYNYGNSH